jgi:ABC-2 type transport system ATP-binding protein
MISVECKNLVKVFSGRKAVRALDGLSLSVEEGEVFGLLGPNGSGKTTFVKCCLNIIYPTSGRIRVLGRRPGNPQTTRQIGYLPENANFYDHLTGRQFLHYHAELARIPFGLRDRRVDEVQELVRLEPSASRRRLRTYSKGMLQRVGLAQALLAKPKLIFLDEPQTGLDPIGRREVKNIMADAARDGATVLFSSHVLGDVEDVADRVAIIDRGKLRRVASLDELTLRTNRVMVRLRPRGAPDAVAGQMEVPASIALALGNLGAGSASYSGGVLECTLVDESMIPKLVHDLCSAGCEIYEVTQERMSLEQTFLKEFGAEGIVAHHPNSTEAKTS